MTASALEHIRTQAVVVARFTGSDHEGRVLIREALKEHPQLVVDSLAWFDMIMSGLAREQVFKWIAQGYTILSNGVPMRTFGHLWAYLDRLDEERDHVLVLDELLKWSDQELAAIWLSHPAPERKL